MTEPAPSTPRRAIPASDGIDVLIHAAPEMGRAIVMLMNGVWSASAWLTPDALREMASRCEAAAAVLAARLLEDGK